MPRAPSPSGRKSLLLLALVGIGIGGAWWWQRPPPDPVHDGQRLSEWLTALAGRKKGDWSLREELHAFGPAAIPWLSFKLEHGRRQYGPGPWPFEKAPDWLRRCVPQRWGGLRASPPFDERETAAEVLFYLGPDAAPAIPALARGLVIDDEEANRRFIRDIADTLYAIGPTAWPAIFEALEHDGPKARAYLLGYPDYPGSERKQVLESDLPRSAAILVKACRDSDPDLLAQAMATIGWLRRNGPDTTVYDAVIPDLIRLTDDADNLPYSAEALGAFGPAAAAPAVPHLIERLADPSAKIRTSAAWSLGYVDKAEKRSADRLRAMLHDPDAGCRKAAASALQEFGLLPPDESSKH